MHLLLKLSRGLLAFDGPGLGLTERKVSQISDKTSKITNVNENPHSTQFCVNIVKVFLDKFDLKTNVILISHSTGFNIRREICVLYGSYIHSCILPTNGMPGFIRRILILKTALGKRVRLELIRGEIGRVTLHQASCDICIS